MGFTPRYQTKKRISVNQLELRNNLLMFQLHGLAVLSNELMTLSEDHFKFDGGVELPRCGITVLKALQGEISSNQPPTFLWFREILFLVYQVVLDYAGSSPPLYSSCSIPVAISSLIPNIECIAYGVFHCFTVMMSHTWSVHYSHMRGVFLHYQGKFTHACNMYSVGFYDIHISES